MGLVFAQSRNSLLPLDPGDILGKYEEWGLTNTWMWDDPWQRFHSTTPYFMPFMLWRDGSVKPCIAYALIAAWFLVLAALISVLLLLRAKARGWGSRNGLPDSWR